MKPHIYAIARIEGNRVHFDGVCSDEGTFSLPVLHGRVQMAGTHLIVGNIQKVRGIDTLCVASAVCVDLPLMLRIAGTAKDGMIEDTAGFKVGLPDGDFEGMVLAVFDGCLILQNSGVPASVPASNVPVSPIPHIEPVLPVAPVVQAETGPEPVQHSPALFSLRVSSFQEGGAFPVATEALDLLNASKPRGRSAASHPPRPPGPLISDSDRDGLIF